MRATFSIIAVFSLFTFIARFLDWIWIYLEGKRMKKADAARVRAEEFKSREARDSSQRVVLGYLDTLSKLERDTLSYCVQMKHQSFNAYLSAPCIATLIQKGLIISDSGAASIDAWPMTIPNYV
jgi:hypothetical protein